MFLHPNSSESHTKRFNRQPSTGPHSPITTTFFDISPSISEPASSRPSTTISTYAQTPLEYSAPQPDRAYIIRSRSNNKVITFLDGTIILDTPGSLGTFRWRCVETKGWIGFQDPASGMYLGYDKNAWLQCAAKKHGEWEYMCPKERPSGGYVLLVEVEGQVLPVGSRTRRTATGIEDAVKIRAWSSEHISWDFIEV